MVYMGMIFQYDKDESRGLIMLSDGEKKEFGTQEWADRENSPKVGQKISYEEHNGRIEVKTASIDAKIVKEREKDKEISAKSISVDEHIKELVEGGFKLVKDVADGTSRTVLLRLYTATDYGEATIEQNGSDIKISKVLNGEKV